MLPSMNTPFLETLDMVSGGDPAATPAASIIVLHGLGADGNDFVPIAQELDLSAIGPVRFVFPNAPVQPVTINGGYEMRAWYDIYPPGADAKGRDYQDLRWSRFKNFAPAEMYTVVGEHVFPLLRTMGGDGSTYAHHMKDARFTIPHPRCWPRWWTCSTPWPAASPRAHARPAPDAASSYPSEVAAPDRRPTSSAPLALGGRQ